MENNTKELDIDFENFLTKEEIYENVEEKQKLGDVNVIVSNQSYKQKTNNHFVILFHNVLEYVITEYQLKLNDIKIILSILKLMEIGNAINITQKRISIDTGINIVSINRSYKNLLKASILLKDDYGSYYFNPQIVSNMNLKKIKEYDSYKLSKSLSKYDSF